MIQPDDEAAEIERELRAALHRIAPLGGERRLQVGAAADALVSLLAELLSRVPSADGEVERLVGLFRERLIAALAAHAERGAARRH